MKKNQIFQCKICKKNFKWIKTKKDYESCFDKNQNCWDCVLG